MYPSTGLPRIQFTFSQFEIRIEFPSPDRNDEGEEFNLVNEFFKEIYENSKGNEKLKAEEVHRPEMTLCGAN